MNYCPNCGAALTPDAKFCPSCGTPVAPSASVPPEFAVTHKRENPLTGGIKAGTTGCVGCLTFVVLFIIFLALVAGHH